MKSTLYLCVSLFLFLMIAELCPVSVCGQDPIQEPVYLPREMNVLDHSDLPNVFPRSSQPAQTLLIFDAQSLSRSTQDFVASIQGLVNREQPQFYLILSRNRISPIVEEGRRESIDQVWLEWLKERQYVESYSQIENVEGLIARFKIRDVVVVDPELPAGINIATMLSAVRGIPMAYPEDVEKYGLNPIEDTRGRWKTNIEAYQWAFQNLWPELNHAAIAVFSPNIHGHLRDYLVGQKIFTFWLPNADYRDAATTDHDLKDFEDIIKQMPVNIPVLGYPHGPGRDSGIGEGSGVLLLSKYAKFLVPTDWHTNLSIWTGWDPKTSPLKQPEPRKLMYDPSKLYLCVLVSDGDNMNLWLDFMPTEKYWRNPLRGQFPIAWTLGPAMLQLHAPLLDYYYESMTPKDSFGCAVSGLGYMYPKHYGEAYGSHQEEIFRRYLELTNQFNQKLNLRWYWGTIIGDRGGVQWDAIAKQLNGMTCLMEGYGRQWWKDEPYLTNGIPTFHFMNDALPEKETAEQVHRFLRRRDPKFGVIFIQNWEYDLEKIKTLMNGIEGEIEWVLPEELADLFLQSQSSVE